MNKEIAVEILADTLPQFLGRKTAEKWAKI